MRGLDAELLLAGLESAVLIDRAEGEMGLQRRLQGWVVGVKGGDLREEEDVTATMAEHKVGVNLVSENAGLSFYISIPY